MSNGYDASFSDDPMEWMEEPTSSRWADELHALATLVESVEDYKLAHPSAREDTTWSALEASIGEVVANRLGAASDRYELATDLGDVDTAATARRRAHELHVLLMRVMSD